MSDLEQRAIRVLMGPGVKVWRGDWPRVTNLYLLWRADPLWTLSAAESKSLWSLLWKFRRQITDRELLAEADLRVNNRLCLTL